MDLSLLWTHEKQMILSILIPTLPERAKLLQRVCEHLGAFNTGEVEILTDHRGREVTTGKKRNELIEKAKGLYVVHVDDDDFPQTGYIEMILNAIKENNYPDCITFNGFYNEDGGPRINFTIKLGEKYEARNGHVYRWPNHLCPMKKAIAQSVKFPDKTKGEDYEWSKQIADRRLLKTSFHIDKDLYFYEYKSPNRFLTDHKVGK